MPKNRNPKDKSNDLPILIRTYGEFWNPNLVEWNKKELLGTRSYFGKGPTINVFYEKGVYVLYKDFAAVYVGRAENSIGERLLNHRESRRKGPPWDTFSWFGVRGLGQNHRLLKGKGRVHTSTSELIATLEGLLIIAIDPRLNSRREKFKNAVRLHQYVDENKPDELGELREWIKEQLDPIRNAVQRRRSS